MKFTHREIFGIFLLVVESLLALGSWRVFLETALEPNLWNTTVALAWFSFLGASFLLGTVVWEKKIFQIIGAGLLFLPSFLFIHTWYYPLVILIAWVIAWNSIHTVQQEITERLHFHFFHNVRTGAFSLVLGLTLALSGAYYVSIQQASWEELLPRFSTGEGTATAIFKTVAYIYPAWKNLGEEGTTVDQFLLSIKNNQEDAPSEMSTMSSSGTALPDVMQSLQQLGVDGLFDQDRISEELYLQAGRQQIASIVGRPVSGDEKMADIFAVVIQHKIIAALSGGQASQHLPPPIVPFVLTVLLFLTLLPFGSSLSWLWAFLSYLVFRVVLSFGWITLSRATREQEVPLP